LVLGKRCCLNRLVVLLFLTVTSFSALAFEAGDYVTAPSGVTVELRAGPHGQPIGQLSGTESLKVLDLTPRGGWIPVDYNGKAVWVFNAAVRKTNDTNQRDPKKLVMVDAEEGANLRFAPSLSSPVLATIDDNTEVQIIGPGQGAWVPVKWNNKTGYVNKALLSHPESELDAAEKCSGDCAKPSSVSIAKSAAGILAKVATQGESFNLLAKWSLDGYTEGVKTRCLANFRGGGLVHGHCRAWGSGNRSKGLCAAGVKEAAVLAGVCNSMPAGASAIEMHLSGGIRRSCPKLKLSGYRDPRTAPPGSIVVYSGYAGKTPHHFGHIETKLLITAQVLERVKNDPEMHGAKLGQFMYCSDFCRVRPTMTRHNPVAAIYTLE
jgi:uncharacterized protein YgiM (DUF1202 family)